MVRIVFGANEQKMENVAGKTVGELRTQLTEVLNIPANAQAMKNGKPVDDAYSVKEGDSIEFVKSAGKKGC